MYYTLFYAVLMLLCSARVRCRYRFCSGEFAFPSLRIVVYYFFIFAFDSLSASHLAKPSFSLIFSNVLCLLAEAASRMMSMLLESRGNGAVIFANSEKLRMTGKC